jgi:hypothetical protein
MKKRLYGIIRLCSLVLIVLCACGKSTNLIDMSTSEGDEYMAIIWEDRTYAPFCTISKSDCGTQIGYLNGETDDRICEYKDYPTDEWIANHLMADGGAILFKEVNVTHIPDGLESEYEWDSPEIAKLREKYPEYFEVGTFKGLEVYVWQMAENDYRFGLMQGTNREKTLEEMMALKGASPEEMALILSTFDIEDRDIFVISWQNPISSYMITDDMVKDPEYISNIRNMLGLDLDEEQLPKQEEADAMYDRIPMVRVNDKLYYDTGRESTISGRCGNMDGEITSTVDGTEIPTEDNQSNFGSGFGYQYGADDTIEIYMNEKWFVFEYREESE